MKIQTTKQDVKINRTFLAVILLTFLGSLNSIAQPIVDGGNSQTICVGSNTTLGGAPTASGGAGGYTYSWQPLTGLSSATIANPNASPTVTTTYTITVTDAVSAVGTATLTITVNPLPTVTANSTTICAGQTASLFASGASTYSWSTGATTSNINVSPVASTSYTVTGSDFNGCSASAIATVTVNPSPAITVNSSTVCQGQSATLTASGATSYSWSTGDVTSSITITPSTTTSYTVTGTSGGCSGYTTTTVTVNPIPTVNAGSDLTNCVGASVNFSASTSGASFHTWYFGDGGSSTLLNSVHSYGTTGSFPAFILVTDSSGCSASDTILVSITAPNVTYTSTNVTCNGICDGTGVVSVTGGFAPFSYSWSNGFTTSNTSGLCAGTYTATVTDAIGCVSNSTIIINQPSTINLNLSSVNVSCNGMCNGVATASPTGGIPPYTYYWSPSSNTTSTNTGLCSGTYTVTITDMNGCIKSSTTAITQPTPLSVTATLSTTICANTSTMIAGSVSGGTAPYTFDWNDGTVTISTSPNPSVSPASNTIYILNVTDAMGCTGAATDTIMVLSNTNIDGQVTYSGGILSSGINKAILFNKQSLLILFDTVRTTTLDASGYFHFNNVNQGNYLVKIFPDTSIYQTMVPTYYGNEYLWDSASTVIHGCSVSNTANILMVEGSSATGPGNLTGHISEGDGFGRTPGDPVPGIDIKLGRNPGGLFSNTQTDAAGNYAFSNIPANAPGEKYVVYVDIPGIGRDSSYTFSVTGTQNEFNNLDYYVDSAFVHPVYNTTIGINSIKAEGNKFGLFPNPTNDVSTVEYTIASDSKIIISVYNVLGVKMLDIANTKQLAGNYKYTINAKNNNFSPGVYLVSLTINNSTSTHRLVITK